MLIYQEENMSNSVENDNQGYIDQLESSDENDNDQLEPINEDNNDQLEPNDNDQLEPNDNDQLESSDENDIDQNNPIQYNSDFDNQIDYNYVIEEEEPLWSLQLTEIDTLIPQIYREYTIEELQCPFDEDQEFIINHINSFEEWLCANMIIFYGLDHDANTSAIVQFVARITGAENNLEYYYQQNFSELQIMAIMFRYYNVYDFGPSIQEYISAQDFFRQYVAYNSN